MTLPAEYVRPPEKVVVAAPIHAPFKNESTCPAVPEYRVEVETAVGTAVAPVPLAKSVPAAIDESPTLPAEYVRPDEKVVVATHDGMPPAIERILPLFDTPPVSAERVLVLEP